MSMQFKSLEEMASKLEILTLKEVKELFTKEESQGFTDHYYVAMISAHTESKILIDSLISKYNLHPITYSIHDGDEGTDYVYETGFVYVNREGFLLAKIKGDGMYIDSED